MATALFVMDPIEHLAYEKDTTLGMMYAGQLRGHSLAMASPAELFVDQGIAMGLCTQVTVAMDPHQWYCKGAQQTVPLADYDYIFMRIDPPFDMNYIYVTYLLSLAEDAGACVVNAPRSLRDRNEKFSIARLPQYAPPFLVSRDLDRLSAFIDQYPHTVVKPLDVMGGQEIYKMAPAHFNTAPILEAVTRGGTRFVMAQLFLDAIEQGDKRILLVHGAPVDTMVVRLPDPKKMRGNLDQGATVELAPLGVRERAIADAVAHEAAGAGLYLIGIDVIGDYLTEVNITSPTGVRFMDGADSSNPVLAHLWAGLEGRP